MGVLFGAIAGFGFGSFALRLGAGRSVRELISTMLLLRLGMIVMVAGTLGVVFGLHAGSAMAVMAVGLLALSVELLSDLVQGVLSGQLRHGAAALVIVVQRVFPLVGVLVGQLLGWPLLGATIGLAFTFPFQLGVVWPYLSRPSAVPRTIKLAKHFWGATVVSSLTQLDVSMVGIVAGAEAAGHFTVGNRVVSPLGFLTSAMLNIFVPELTLAAPGEARRTIFRRIRRIAISAAIALVICAIPIAQGVIFFVGDQYQPALPAIGAFVVAAALSGISRTYQALFFAEDCPRIVTMAVVLGALAGFATILALGSILGIVGAALGPIVAQVVILVAFTVSLRRISSQPKNPDEDHEKLPATHSHGHTERDK